MAINNMNELVNAMTTSLQNIPWSKTSAATEGTGTFFDFSQTTGVPGAIATPDAASSGGTSYTSATAGALPFTAPVGGQTTYLLNFNATSTVAGSLYLVDRLWACRNLTGTLGATTAVVGMSDITRYNSGVGAEIWFWAIAGGAYTAGDITVSYTNSAGVSGRTCTINIGTGSATPFTAGQCFVGGLQAGDTGVRSVQSVTNTSASFSSGGLIIARRLVTAPSANNCVGVSMDGLRTGLQQIDSNACLGMILLCTTTITGYWTGNIQLVQG